MMIIIQSSLTQYNILSYHYVVIFPFVALDYYGDDNGYDVAPRLSLPSSADVDKPLMYAPPPPLLRPGGGADDEETEIYRRILDGLEDREAEFLSQQLADYLGQYPGNNVRDHIMSPPFCHDF